MEEPTHAPGRDESAWIHHPHDKLAKHAFSDIPTAAAFFRSYLPQQIVRLLDFERLKLIPGSYIDEEFQHTESDLLFSVPYKKKTTEQVFPYLLFEHLSSEKPLTPFQLLLYMVNIWRDLRKQFPNLKKLPIIIPVVLAQSKRKWKLSTSFHDLIHLPSPDHQELLRYVPDFQFKLIELVDLPFHKIVGTPFGILTMRTLKAQPLRQLLSDPVWDENLMTQVHEWTLETLLRYIFNAEEVDRISFVDRLKRIQNPQIKKNTMTLAEQLRQEGRLEAENEVKTLAEQLRQEGRIENLKTIISSQLSQKFGELPYSVTEQLQSAPVERLEQWIHRILTANTLEEVLV